MKRIKFTLVLIAFSLNAFSQKNVIETNTYLRNKTNSGWEQESKANHYYHNGDDSVVTYSKVRNASSGALDNLHEESFIYGKNHRIERNSIKHWEGLNNMVGEYNKESRLNNTYKDVSVSGGTKTILSLSVKESWNKSGSKWDTSTVIILKPDTYGNVQSRIEQYGGGIKVENFYKSTFSYDGSNKETQELRYTWVNNAWKEHTKKIVTYVTGTNRVDNFEYFKYDSAAKKFSTKLSLTQYSYDVNNLTDSVIYSGWNASSSSYKFQTRVLYTYDDDGDVTEELMEIYDAKNSVWNYFKSTTYLYQDKSSINTPLSAQLNVYPIPAQDGFTIESSSIQEAKLYTVDGQIVKYFAPSSTILKPYISTVNLKSGTYYLEVILTDNRIVHKKIIINH